MESNSDVTKESITKQLEDMIESESSMKKMYELDYLKNNKPVRGPGSSKSITPELNRSFLEDIFDNFNEFVEYDQNTMTDYYVGIEDEYNEETRKKERRIILSQNPFCSRENMEMFKQKLSSINSGNLSDLLSNNFNDPSVMAGMACLVSSVAHLPSKIEENDKEYVKRIKKIITKSIVLARGAAGVAFESKFDGVKDAIVVKSSHGQDDLVREMFIGATLNKLRESIPNFSYVYGGFTCGRAKIVKDKAELCKKTKKIDYVIYENITNSARYIDYVKNNPPIDVLSMYIQCLFALDVAHREYDFTHYDLHSGNLLVRNPKEEYIIPYKDKDGKIEYIKSKGIATFIDYGSSHILLNGEHYGYNFLQYSVLANTSFPMYDAHKLLLYTTLFLKKEDRKMFIPLFKFFNRTDSLDEAIKNDDYYYALPYTANVGKITYRDFIDYIKREVPEAKNIIFDQPPPMRVLSCSTKSDNDCMDGIEQFESEVFDDKKVEAKTNINTQNNEVDKIIINVNRLSNRIENLINNEMDGFDKEMSESLVTNYETYKEEIITFNNEYRDITTNNIGNIAKASDILKEIESNFFVPLLEIMNRDLARISPLPNNDELKFEIEYIINRIKVVL